MMPVVRVNDPAFADLAILTKWWGTKTPSETIARLAREAMDDLGIGRDDDEEAVVVAADGAMQFDKTPSMAFTKPLAASISGKAVPNPRWANILLGVIKAVHAQGVTGATLVRALNIHSKATRYEEDGFKYHEELGISFQGQSASDAWKEIERLANAYRIPVSVEFWWRQNPKAQFPGKTGKLYAGQ